MSSDDSFNLMVPVTPNSTKSLHRSSKPAHRLPPFQHNEKAVGGDVCTLETDVSSRERAVVLRLR